MLEFQTEEGILRVMLQGEIDHHSAGQLREQIDCPQFELNASTFVPELWRSQRFQQYYQEILWTS